MTDVLFCVQPVVCLAFFPCGMVGFPLGRQPSDFLVTAATLV